MKAGQKRLHWLVHLYRGFTLRCFVSQFLNWLALHNHSLPPPHQPLSSPPNLLFLEPLPLLTATGAHTDVWIGGGFLTNYLTPHSAREKEEGPHHFFASPLMECVCLSGFAAVSTSHNPQPTVSGERERDGDGDVVWSSILSHQSLTPDTSSQKPLSTWCLTKLH